PDGYDPSFLFDDDGTCYFTRTSHQRVAQFTLDPKTGKRTSDERVIWSGTGGRWPEAPHLYKIRGKYYLLLAEGGTEFGHMATLARSDSPWGPFEECPHNPILSHRNHAAHALQAVGHADFIEAHDGSWWLVALGIRTSTKFGSYHHLGRETLLAPLEWAEDGWPRVNQNGTAPEEFEGPSFAEAQAAETYTRENFDARELADVWNHRHNPVRENYSLAQRPGWLTLKGGVDTLDTDIGTPTFVGRRQQHFDCRTTTLIDFEPSAEGEEAGLSALMNPMHHYEVFVTRRDGQRVVQARRTIGDLSGTSAAIPVEKGPLVLEIRATNELYRLGFSQGDGAFRELATGQTRYLSKEVTGGFMGVYLALYATGNGQASKTRAHFDWFNYEPSEPV
ncbi:MAG TPA: family 43 glycosylhydrolase, partial [Polyangiaceae bacterium]|nr:family 43 glycosylhydrolase [Polyangiaceae bacterium]